MRPRDVETIVSFDAETGLDIVDVVADGLQFLEADQ